MDVNNQDAIKQFQSLMENLDEQQKNTFQLIDCLQWRVENEIDNILAKPIPTDLYRDVRDSQLIGMSGYSKEGLPVITIGVGLNTFDKVSDQYYIQSHIQMNEYRDRVILLQRIKNHGRYIGTCVKVLDMTGLKLSALNQLRVAKPLLQERTKRKVQVLQGFGREELLKKEGFQVTPTAVNTENCFSFDHVFHKQLYNYIKLQAIIMESISPIREGSFYVDLPESDTDGAKIVKTMETEFHKLEIQNGLTN